MTADLTTVQNLINALVIFVFAALALFTAGGAGAFLLMMRQHKRDLENAYQALPPDAQKLIFGLIDGLKGFLDIAYDVVTPDESAPGESATTPVDKSPLPPDQVAKGAA